MSSQTERERLQHRALALEYATIGWNLIEAVITIGLGIAAGSLALIGFGSDSVVEVFASAVVVWHIAPRHREDDPARTGTALRLVALAFLALALVLAVVAVRDLVTGREAEASPWGIAYLALTAVVMFTLARAKRTTARALRSAPLRSEAAMTSLDGVLATLMLIGLSLNAVLDWWWADPAAALVVAVAAANEARENWVEAGELT